MMLPGLNQDEKHHLIVWHFGDLIFRFCISCAQILFRLRSSEELGLTTNDCATYDTDLVPTRQRCDAVVKAEILCYLCEEVVMCGERPLLT